MITIKDEWNDVDVVVDSSNGISENLCKICIWMYDVMIGSCMNPIFYIRVRPLHLSMMLFVSLEMLPMAVRVRVAQTQTASALLRREIESRPRRWTRCNKKGIYLKNSIDFGVVHSTNIIRHTGSIATSFSSWGVKTISRPYLLS